MFYGYRIEDQKEGHGIWRDFDGSWNPVFDKLDDGLCKSLPMENSGFYHYGGKDWFSAAPTRETLKMWFSKRDAEQLQEFGYRIFEFELAEIRTVSDTEIVFTRDSVIRQRELEIRDIWREV